MHRNSRNLGSRERLLRAASALFSVKGYHGTSTRDLAKRAHVNETTIFRLFKSKKDLYVSVLERHVGRSDDLDWLQLLLQSSADEETVLTALVNRLQQLLRPESLRLILFAALENPELLRKYFRSRTLHFCDVLGSHIQRRIECGSLRNLDPQLMGRAFVAMVTYHHAFLELMGVPELSQDPSQWLKTYTSLWLHGALADAGPPPNTLPQSLHAEERFHARG